MLKRKGIFIAVFAVTFTIISLFTSISVYAEAKNYQENQTRALKKDMQGSNVTALQKDLAQLGFFNAEITGYYGDITASAVKALQGRHGLDPDGITGNSTFSLINRLLGRVKTTGSNTAVSRGTVSRNEYLIPWFGGADKIFARGTEAKVYDIDTGLSFNVKRTYGVNHADCEALTADDTAVMKKIYGGQWSWLRRAVIVLINGKRIAASMAGMPHAGVDKLPGEIYVRSRSGGYGSGINLDEVKGNGMSGHFDIHFYKSRTHRTDSIDSEHQAMVLKAAEWAKNNY